jgi:hypothetical protein
MLDCVVQASCRCCGRCVPACLRECHSARVEHEVRPHSHNRNVSGQPCAGVGHHLLSQSSHTCIPCVSVCVCVCALQQARMFSEQMPTSDGTVPPFQFLPSAVPFVSANVTITPNFIHLKVTHLNMIYALSGIARRTPPPQASSLSRRVAACDGTLRPVVSV